LWFPKGNKSHLGKFIESNETKENKRKSDERNKVSVAIKSTYVATQPIAVEKTQEIE
jgi:hypothetical protein